MVDAQGKNGYPPSRNSWQYAPPPRSSGLRWIIALAAVAALVVGACLVALVVVVDSQDRPTTIDDDGLTRTIAVECQIMTVTVESLPVVGTAQRQSEAILDQNRAVKLMLAAIRSREAAAIRSDPPAGAWLADWERLVAARAALARELLRDPNASLEQPVDSAGRPISERMDEVWRTNPACLVPPSFASPDSDALSG